MSFFFLIFFKVFTLLVGLKRDVSVQPFISPPDSVPTSRNTFLRGFLAFCRAGRELPNETPSLARLSISLSGESNDFSFPVGEKAPRPCHREGEWTGCLPPTACSGITGLEDPAFQRYRYARSSSGEGGKAGETHG